MPHIYIQKNVFFYDKNQLLFALIFATEVTVFLDIAFRKRLYFYSDISAKNIFNKSKSKKVERKDCVPYLYYLHFPYCIIIIVFKKGF